VVHCYMDGTFIQPFYQLIDGVLAADIPWMWVGNCTLKEALIPCYIARHNMSCSSMPQHSNWTIKDGFKPLYINLAIEV
jgi:hypothetical protein